MKQGSNVNTEKNSVEIEEVEGRKVEGKIVTKTLIKTGNITMLKITFEKEAYIPPHRHSFETVGYVLKGKLKLEIGGEEKTVKEGDTWVHPRKTIHSTKAITPSEWIEVRIH